MSRHLLTTFYSLSIMSLQTLSDIMNITIHKEHKSNRPEKGEIFFVAFPAPPAPFRAAHFSAAPLRRAVAGLTARLHQRFSKFSWRLASMLLLKVSSNFLIQGAPNSKSRFFGRGRPGFLHLASHFLADDVEVRANGVLFRRIPLTFDLQYHANRHSIM